MSWKTSEDLMEDIHATFKELSDNTSDKAIQRANAKAKILASGVRNMSNEIEVAKITGSLSDKKTELKPIKRDV